MIKVTSTYGRYWIQGIAIALLFCGSLSMQAQNTSINATGNRPDSSAMLDVSSTTQGFLMPRMTAAQRNAIANPAFGLMVLQADGNKGIYMYDTTGAGSWKYVLDSLGVVNLINSIAGGDTLGNHQMTQNLETGGNFISNDGDNEGIMVQNDGRVAIGSTNSEAKVTIVDSTTNVSQNLLTLRNPIMPNNSHVNLKFGQSQSYANQAEIRFTYQSSGSDSNRFAFGFNSIQPFVAFTANERVGIGTEIPSADLDVEGKGQFDTIEVEGAYTFPTAAPTTTGQVITYDGTNLIWDTVAAGNADTLPIIQSGDGTTYVDAGTNEQISIGFNGVESMRIDSAHIDLAGTNFFIGRNAGQNISTGADNFAAGDEAMQNTTVGGNNIALGERAAQNMNGGTNIAIGYRSMRNSTNSGGNVGVGQLTMASMATGQDNVAIGSMASGDATSGTNNVAIGHDAGRKTSGVGNVFIGKGAGDYDPALNTQNLSIKIGFEAGANDTTDRRLFIHSSNTATPLIWGDMASGIASQKLQVNGAFSTAIDTNAGDTLFYPTADGNANDVLTTDGSGNLTFQPISGGSTDTTRIADADNDTKIQVEESNDEDLIRFDLAGTEQFRMDGARFEVLNSGQSVFFGNAAGFNDDGTSNTNVFIGDSAGFATTSGAHNTAIGYRALRSSTNGNFNAAIGINALLNLSSGGSNNVLGSYAGAGITSGQSNVLIGTDAGGGYQPHSKSGVTAVGYHAGKANIGSNNVFLGNQAGALDSTSSNVLYIENSSSSTPLIWGDFANDSVKVYGALSIGDSFTFPITDGANGQTMITDGAGNLTWGTVSGASLWTNSGTNTYLSTGTRLGVGTITPSAGFVATFYANGGGSAQGGLFVDNSVDGNTRKTGVVAHLDTGGNLSKNAFKAIVEGKNAGNDTLASFYSQISNNFSGDLGFGLYSDFLTSVGTNYGVYSNNADYNYLTGNTGINEDTARAALDVRGKTILGDAFLPTTATNGVNILTILSGLNSNAAENGISFHENNTGFGMHLSYDGTSFGDSNKLEISNSAYEPLVTFFHGGQVGIGTEVPEEELDVEGTAIIDTLTINSAFTLPSVDGTSGQVMTTDGSGNLSWGAGGGSGYWNNDANGIHTDSLTGIGGKANSAFALTVHADSLQKFGILQWGDPDFFNTMTLRSGGGAVDHRVSMGMYDTSGVDNRFTIGTNPGTGWTNPLQIELGAPSNTIYVDSVGDISIGGTTMLSDEKLLVNSNTSSWGIMNTDGNIALGTWIGTTAGQFGTFTNHRVDIFTNNGAPKLTVDTTGRVGIGNVSPRGMLEVSGNILSMGQALTAVPVGDHVGVMYNNSTSSGLIHSADGATPEPLELRAGTLTFATTSNIFTQSPRMTIDANGNVGVGTTSPDSLLDVAGSATIDKLNINSAFTFPTTDGTNGQVMQTDGSGNLSWTVSAADGDGIYDGSGSLSGNTVVTQGANTLDFTTTATDGFSVDGTTFSVDGANNRVGIGTASPAEKLEVSGGDARIYGITVGRGNSSVSSNTAVGSGALDAATGASYSNTAVGISALGANTSGHNNTAIGKNAMPSNQGGNDNTAIGVEAMNVANGGSLNTAVGLLSMRFLTTGQRNASVGTYSLQGTTTGAANVAMGHEALQANTTGDSNTAIGAGADLGSNNLSNATAIGSNALVSASNSLVLGNNANVGIGTSTPSEKLDVVGTATVDELNINSAFTLPTSDGTNGQVMTTNGSGVVSWSNAGSGDGDGIYDGSGSLSGNTVVTQGANTLDFTTTSTDGFSVDGTTFSVDGNNNRVGIGTASPQYELEVNGAIRTGSDGTDGQLRLYAEQGGTDYQVIFNPHGTMTQTTTYTLPPNDGDNGQVLTSNGAGSLTWTDGPADSDWTVAGGIVYNTSDRFAVGTSTMPASYFSEIETPASAVYAIGFSVDQNYTGAAQTFGALSSISNGGTGIKYGFYTTVAGNASQTNELYGTFNQMSGGNSEPMSGTYNSVLSNGTGEKYGIVNNVTANASQANDIYGSLNEITTVNSGYTAYGNKTEISGSGNLVKYGDHITITEPAAQTSATYGTFINTVHTGTNLSYGQRTLINGTGDGNSTSGLFEVSNTGDGTHTGIETFVVSPSSSAARLDGIYQDLSHDGAGQVTGMFLTIDNDGTGSRSGINQNVASAAASTSYGTQTNMDIDGTGPAYGSYVSYTGSTGTGTHYGTYMDGEDDNYFSGNVGIGDNTPSYELDVAGTVNSTTGVRTTGLGINTGVPSSFEIDARSSLNHIMWVESSNTSTSSKGITIRLGVATPTTSSLFTEFRRGNGSVIGSISGNGVGGVLYNTTSDRRLKMNIADIENALDLIDGIQPRRYELKANPGHEEFGFIAQELQQIYPQAVAGDSTSDINESPMTVDYSRLTPILAAGIKELNDKIRAQEAEIDALRAQNERHEDEKATLEQRLDEHSQKLSELTSAMGLLISEIQDEKRANAILDARKNEK